MIAALAVSKITLTCLLELNDLCVAAATTRDNSDERTRGNAVARGHQNR